MKRFNITKIDSTKLSNEITEFGPVACMDCDFDGPISIDYYVVKPVVENENDYKEVQLLVKKQLGYESFSEIGSDVGGLISVCKCPKCGSEEIFQDF